MRKCVTIMFLLFSLISLAEQTTLNDKVTGIWFLPSERESASFEWEAAWIWEDESLDADAIFARRTVRLSSLPEQAVLRITASSVYQLYINGEYICRGPARSAPHHQLYDMLDVTKMLQPGENTIAVRVHHQKGTRSYQYDGRAGLLVQLTFQTDDEESVLISDRTWKILPDKSWDNNAPSISRFSQVVNDRVDFRNYPHGWQEPDFDDSEWRAAIELMRKTGWPAPQTDAKAQPLTPPWTTLVPRDIPYLDERKMEAEKLIEALEISFPIVEKAHSLTEAVGLKKQDGAPLRLPASSDSTLWLLIYDFGEVINGMARLELKGSTGTEVEIISAPFILNNHFTHRSVDSEFRDIIVLSGNMDTWEATYFKPTRYLGVVTNNTENLQLYYVGIHQIAYPFLENGRMHSTSDTWINKYMQATAKTINVSTTDAYTDNYRERRQYAQTGYYAAMGNYWIFGDYALQRRYLVQVAQEQFANGIMPAYAPADTEDYMIILDSNCLWIRSLHNYYLHSGDEQTVRELFPAAKKLMELLHSFTGNSGLIDNPPFAYWLDHAQNDRRGANFTLNGHYLGALEDFIEILDWLQNSDAKVFKDRATKLRIALQLFWDNERQLFSDALVSGELSEMFSEHAQAMALSMEVATPVQADAIAGQILVKDNHNYIKRESGITMVTPAMSYFLHKGLCNYGFVDESFELFRNRFDKMLQPDNNGTLWEEWWLDGSGRTGSFRERHSRCDAQTESAFAPALFAEFMAGIIPVKPGMKEVRIQRTGSSVKDMDCIVPTPHGPLKVRWEMIENAGNLLLDIPDGILVTLDISSLQKQGKGDVTINGEQLPHEVSENRFYGFERGNYTIEF